MTKRAFLIGCNSAGLAHCDTDAELMRKALEQHEYVITHIEDPEHKTPYYKLLEPLQIFVNSCENEDTMVFYFAGHSLNLGKENYKFVLADDINKSDNQLLASILIPILRQSKAADKLLIFDCCQSGKATELVYDWNRDAGEHFRIFTATSSKTTALEVDGETGGGLFTSWIYRGLTIDTAALADADGYLRVGKLGEYARSWALRYKSPGGRPAPIPRIYGSTDQDITLTGHITSTFNPSTGSVSDIFISYAREDQPRVKPLVYLLESQGWTVFWDLDIPPGERWRSWIGRNLDEARLVIVAWSKDSIDSRWVQEEVDEAIYAKKPVFPILLDRVRLPMGYRSIHAANFTEWDGTAVAPVAVTLLKWLARKLGATPVAREETKQAERDREAKCSGK